MITKTLRKQMLLGRNKWKIQHPNWASCTPGEIWEVAWLAGRDSELMHPDQYVDYDTLTGVAEDLQNKIEGLAERITALERKG